MSSEIKATNYKAKDGTAGISIADLTGRVSFIETNPSLTLGTNTTFPSGMITFRSAVIEDSTDSGDVTTDASNLFIGFGTIQGPIALATGYRMNIYATGGQFKLNSNTNYGPSINYKTGSTFSSTTDGSVVRTN